MIEPRTTTATPLTSRPTRSRLTFIPLSLLLVLLAAAGCGRSDDTATTTALDTTTTTTTAETNAVRSTTTTAAAGTTALSPPTTTTDPTTARPGVDDRYVVGAEPGVFPRLDTTTGPQPGSKGAGGFGCTPASAGLPDGIWFGLVTAKAGNSITFDLACFFFGPIAVEEGANDGIVVDPVGEVYIRNSNPTVRTIAVDPSVPVYEYLADLTDTLEVPFNATRFAEWPHDPTFSQPCPGKFCGVWLFVNDGAVTEMLEQFFAPCVGSSTFNCVPVVW